MLDAHATVISLEGAAVLLRGQSGSGKSDLALRLIDEGAVLVADDRVRMRVVDGRLLASAPENLAGLLEVRGQGIVAVDFIEEAQLRMVVDLVQSSAIERMPEAASAEIAGIRLPLLKLAPFDASAPAKLRLAVRGAGPHSWASR